MIRTSQGEAIEHDDLLDIHKHRTKVNVEIRKQNRRQIFDRLRFKANTNEEVQPDKLNLFQEANQLLIYDPRYYQELTSYETQTYTLETVSDLAYAVLSQNTLQNHYGMIGFNKLLCGWSKDLIQRVIDEGLITPMMKFAEQKQYPHLRYCAVSCLSNILGGTAQEIKSIVEKGGVKMFIEIVNENEEYLMDGAFAAILNLGSDITYFRDAIIRQKGLEAIIKVCNHYIENTNLFVLGCWTVANLLRGNPLPLYQQVKHAVTWLCTVITSNILDQKPELREILWAISYHSDCQQKKQRVVVQAGSIPNLLKYLIVDKTKFSEKEGFYQIIPALRILGNISTGASSSTQALLDNGILVYLEQLIDSKKKSVRRESCWVLSNIAAGNEQQVGAFLLEERLINKLIDMFADDEIDVKNELCFVFANMSYQGHRETVFQFYSQIDIIQYYAILLKLQSDQNILISVLQCLENILRLGEHMRGNGKNVFTMELYKKNVINTLEKLQYHQSTQVYQLTSNILNKHFQIIDPLQKQ